MKVELLSIGDELLIGQTVNTNAAWLGKELSMSGFNIIESKVIRDRADEIEAGFKEAMERADLVLVTGGLGPTQDDITKDVLCRFFDTRLVMNETVLEHVEGFFEKRGRGLLEVNRMQAMLPEKATILRNDHGTASGMWFERDGKVLLSLPGVPYEMQFIMENEGFRMIKDYFKVKTLYYRTIQVQGMGESFLAERIKDIEDELRSVGLALAYLPQPGLVRLRITGPESTGVRKKIGEYIGRILHRLPSYAFDSEESLSAFTGNILRSGKQNLSTVESCTGGALSAEIVSVPGSSDYYSGSIISYSDELKRDILGVSDRSLKEHGAVSREVVLQMASNGRKYLGTDYCLATSGIAGPDGGTDEKPVGTVWIAVAGPEGEWAKRFQFGTDRERNIRMTVLTALNLLRCELSGISVEKS